MVKILPLMSLRAKRSNLNLPKAATFCLCAIILLTTPANAITYYTHHFEKLQLTDKFYSEGANVGDFNSAAKRNTLGKAQLKKKPHTLTIKILTANPNAVKAYMFGLDDIRLKPVK